MAQKFKLNLLKKDWELLDEIAIEKGFKGFREMVPSLLKKGSEKMELPNNVKCDQQRFQNHFPIPPELQGFYINLGCHNATSIAFAIFRFMIIPEILAHEKKKAIKKIKLGKGKI